MQKLCKQVMRPVAHGHLFCSTLQFGQLCRMFSMAKTEEERDSDGGGRIAAKVGEGIKKADFEVGGVPLQCTRNVWNTEKYFSV